MKINLFFPFIELISKQHFLFFLGNLMNKIVFALLLVSTFFLISCKDNGVGPRPEDKPGRRDYVWTVDTIRTFNPIYRMWGSAPNDVWAITVGTFTEDIYHFDGIKWSAGQYVLPNPYSPHSIFGFAGNDIYIGAQNRICHFDGSNWKEIATLTKDEHSYDIVLDNIWGISTNDLYAFGAFPDEEGYFNKSVIAHYSFGKWETLNTDKLNGIVERLYMNLPDNKIYLRLTKIGGSKFIDSTIIYEYKKDRYYPIYSNIEAQGLQADLSLINGEVYFILGKRIAKRIDNQFHTVLNIDDPNFYQRIWGRNSKDIFLLMTDGLAHYNGTDLEYLFHFTHGNEKPWTQIYGAALFEKEVFFTVDEPTTNLELIYHGKLKE